MIVWLIIGGFFFFFFSKQDVSTLRWLCLYCICVLQQSKAPSQRPERTPFSPVAARIDARLVALASLRVSQHFSPCCFVHTNQTATSTPLTPPTHPHATHHLHQYHTPWLRSRLPANQKCLSIFGPQASRFCHGAAKFSLPCTQGIDRGEQRRG